MIIGNNTEIDVGFVLHFFQPWWNAPEIVRRVTEQCYGPFFKFAATTRAPFVCTVNVHAGLIEFLRKHYPETFGHFQSALMAGKLELLGTAREHPIIPIIPFRETRRQIRSDEERKIRLGIHRNSSGFWFPEAAFSLDALSEVRRAGYRWTVLDDNSFPHHEKPYDHILACRDMLIFLRSWHWSRYLWADHIDFGTLKEKMRMELPSWVSAKRAYIIFAMDGETFGEHIRGFSEKTLFPMAEEWGGNGTIKRMEELCLLYPVQEISRLREGSWSTGEDDFARNERYPLWDHSQNMCHWLLWQLVHLALRYTERTEDAREDGMRITNSCHWWWMSGRPHREARIMLYGAKKACEIVERFGDKRAIWEARRLLFQLEHFNE